VNASSPDAACIGWRAAKTAMIRSICLQHWAFRCEFSRLARFIGMVDEARRQECTSDRFLNGGAILHRREFGPEPFPIPGFPVCLGARFLSKSGRLSRRIG